MTKVFPSSWFSSRGTATAAIVFGCALVSYTYVLAQADQNDNVLSRWDLTRAIVERQTLSIDAFQQNTNDKALVDGHYYSDKAPGTSFLGVLAYGTLRVFAFPFGWTPDENLGREWTRILTVSIPSAFLVLLVFFAARGVGCSEFWAAAVALAYGLGTPAFAYATLFYGHQIAAFCAFSAMLLITPLSGSNSTGRPKEITNAPRKGGTKAGRGKKANAESAAASLSSEASNVSRPVPTWRLILAGLACGWGVLTEYPVVLAVGIFGLYLLLASRPRARVGWFILGGIPVAICLLGYNWLAFGDALTFGYAHEESKEFREGMAAGIGGVQFPTLDKLWLITFSLSRGLFTYSPFLLLAISGIWRTATLKPRDARLWISALVSIAFVTFNAAYYMPHGGWSCGPRHLLPALPFMAVLCGAAIANPRWAWMRTVFLALAAVAVVKMSLATAIDPQVPEVFVNPVRGFWWPLGREGYSATSWGSLAGLSGIYTVIPLLMLAMGTLLWIAWRSGSRNWSITQAALFLIAFVVASAPNFSWAPIDAQMAHFRAVLFTRQGMRPAALREYTEVIGKDMQTETQLLYRAEAFRQLGLECIQEQKSSEAVNFLLEAARLQPRSPEIRTLLGVALAATGNTADAIAALEDALKIDPHYEPAKQYLDQLRKGSG